MTKKGSRLFEAIPSGFFNCLSSAGNQNIYSDCLLLIYEQYDREISYRILRNQIRDVLAIYLLEHHIHWEDLEEPSEEIKNYNDTANAIIRRFCSPSVGWLEEETDEATYEKYVIMTEPGILLAEFLQQLYMPEREEFSSYIYDIYNTLKNKDQWQEEPYVNGLAHIYRNARLLSRSLKRLSTFIKRIIEKMVEEETLESLTENIMEYCEGSFVREYARLTKQQNIHIYRTYIRKQLDEMKREPLLFEQLVQGCMQEEELEEYEAADMVLDRIDATRRFLVEDYDRIMMEIRHKIQLYLQLAVGRLRFLRNRDSDARGSVEQTIRILVQEMQETGWKEELPAEMQPLFALERHEFLDTGSIRYPRQNHAIGRETTASVEEMTQEDIEKARRDQEKEAYNPYSKEKMKQYLDTVMKDREVLDSGELPLQSKNDLLCALSAAAYSQQNGYEIRALEGYVEADGLLLRRFEMKPAKKTSER